MEEFSRNVRLIGEAGQQRLFEAKVALFGLGGVGGHLFEALVRAGVGKLLVVDGDLVTRSNLNRQLLATWDMMGLPKTLAAQARARAVRPACVVEARHCFLTPENAGSFDFSGFDYVCDAMDDVPAKIALIARARDFGVPVISCMGTGNKLDPGAFRVEDVEKTSVCPLARVMRRELKKRGLTVKAVYSTEPPRPSRDGQPGPGSISFVPAAAGLVMAGEVIRSLIGAGAPSCGAWQYRL